MPTSVGCFGVPGVGQSSWNLCLFVPLLIPVLVRESLLSSWSCQELFFKAGAAKGAAQCCAGNGISGVLQPSLGSGTAWGRGWNLLSVVMMFTNRKNPGAKWKAAVYTGESSLPEDSEHSKLLSWADGIPTPTKNPWIN